MEAKLEVPSSSWQRGTSGTLGQAALMLPDVSPEPNKTRLVHRLTNII